MYLLCPLIKFNRCILNKLHVSQYYCCLQCSPKIYTVVDAIDAFSLFMVRSVQFNLVPLKPLLTGLITNLDTRGNSSRPEILETLKKVEFTVILDICWDTPTEAVDLINGSICPWSSCSGDDIHERIMLTFVEHVSSSCPPSHTTTSPEGDSSNPIIFF
jgi:hypothetical protein